MKLYLLASKDNTEISVNLPIHFGRTIRAYKSEATARNFAKRFRSSVVEVDLEKETVKWLE